MDRRDFLKNSSLVMAGLMLGGGKSFGQMLGGPSNVDDSGVTERYWLNDVRFDYNNAGVIGMRLNATSQADPEQTDGKEYHTGTGLLTTFNMTARSVEPEFGNRKADTRLLVDRLEFNKPGYSLLANVRLVVMVDKGTSQFHTMFSAIPDDVTQKSPYEVSKMIFESRVDANGDGKTAVVLNGDTRGDRSDIALQLMDETRGEGGDLGNEQVRIDFIANGLNGPGRRNLTFPDGEQMRRLYETIAIY